ncbi:MAG: hypothetical protein NFV71_02630, partial [Candidatus Accumulibacter sp.]
PFARDLFFAYGSQDRFTVFTGLYARAIVWLGLPNAAALLLGLAHVVWLAGVAWLLRGILAGAFFWAGVVLVATLPATYGSLGLLSYGESFLTARVWSEAFSLLAIGCILRGHRATALLAVALAAAMHPVIAFAAALFVFAYGFALRQQVWLAGIASLLVLVLGQAGMAPFASLGQKMDPLWLGLSVIRSPFVFLDHWQSGEYREPLFFALLLSAAALASAADHRRLWWAALAVVVGGMGLAWLAVYWPGVVLIQMQPWRVLWLVKILAIAAGVRLVQEFWPVSSYCRLLLGGLVACVFTLDSTGLASAVPLLALLVARRRFAVEPAVPVWLRRIGWLAVGAVVLESVFWQLRLAAGSFDFGDPGLARLAVADCLFIFSKEGGWIVFPVLVLTVWWLLHHRPAFGLGLLAASTAVLAYFAAHWQRHSPDQVLLDELRETGHPQLSAIIGPGHLTYWGNGLEHLWFVLHRGSYASFHQAAGTIFYRQTAIEAERRISRLKKLGLPDARFDWLPPVDKQEAEVPVSLGGLIHVCHDPILDFVVLAQSVPGAEPLLTFSLHRPEPKYRLYACAALRALPDPFPAGG